MQKLLRDYWETKTTTMFQEKHLIFQRPKDPAPEEATSSERTPSRPLHKQTLSTTERQALMIDNEATETAHAILEDIFGHNKELVIHELGQTLNEVIEEFKPLISPPINNIYEYASWDGDQMYLNWDANGRKMKVRFDTDFLLSAEEFKKLKPLITFKKEKSEPKPRLSTKEVRVTSKAMFVSQLEALLLGDEDGRTEPLTIKELEEKYGEIPPKKMDELIRNTQEKYFQDMIIKIEDLTNFENKLREGPLTERMRAEERVKAGEYFDEMAARSPAVAEIDELVKNGEEDVTYFVEIKIQESYLKDAAALKLYWKLMSYFFKNY